MTPLKNSEGGEADFQRVPVVTIHKNNLEKYKLEIESDIKVKYDRIRKIHSTPFSALIQSSLIHYLHSNTKFCFSRIPASLHWIVNCLDWEKEGS